MNPKTIIPTLLVTTATAASASTSFSTKCSISRFTAHHPTLTIENATYVPAGSAYGEGAADLGFPKVPTGLPELCAVTVGVESSGTSSVRFGVFLPEGWNGRMMTSGNGGFGGGINWIDMGASVKYGFATLSTDTGHNSTTTDAAWALHNSETRIDFGYRALHLSLFHAKHIIRSFYHADIHYSYYAGCSTGGRQGIREAQEDPESFDGVIVGAPAWWTTHLQPWTLVNGLKNGRLAGEARITPELFPAIRKNVVRQCDGLDGVTDGIVSDPTNCKIDYDLLTCNTSRNITSDCLTLAQISTLKKIYKPWYINGTWQFPGQTPSSEDLFVVLYGALEPSNLGTGYVANFVLNNASWAPELWSDDMLASIDALNPGQTNADNFTGLANFRDRGGKMFLYHGQADSMIPPGSSEYFYNRTAIALNKSSSDSLHDWFRLFHIPGMGHCSDSYVDAPWYIAAANQPAAINTSFYSVPGFADAKHDVILAMMDWVEKGQPVDEVVATAWRDGDPEKGVVRQRPLCAVPKVARLAEGAEEAMAENWTCE